MVQLFKANIILKVIKAGDDGEPKEVNVTLSNVRTDLTPAEMTQLIQAFQTLISYPVSAAQLVQYSHIA
jgi:hypothetical protein